MKLGCCQIRYRDCIVIVSWSVLVSIHLENTAIVASGFYAGEKQARLVKQILDVNQSIDRWIWNILFRQFRGPGPKTGAAGMDNEWNNSNWWSVGASPSEEQTDTTVEAITTAIQG